VIIVLQPTDYYREHPNYPRVSVTHLLMRWDSRGIILARKRISFQ